ncbi:MAG: InlB B-repeat-containing protein [Oscillospiraceae bacterium]|nr:InlB B-repeat-containing protein [Oscillospiraceae bacterium]
MHSSASASGSKVVPTVIAATHTHSYTVKVGTKRAATCTEKGLEIRKCSGCSSITEVNTDALGHDYDKKVVSPTCTARGYTVYTCKRSGCSHSYTGDYTNAKGHLTATKTVPPSCTTQGYSYDYCTRSGCTYKSGNKNYTAVLGHDYSKVIGVKRYATCTEKGLEIRGCSRCSSTTETNTNALGHDMETKTVPSSCTTQGYTYQRCKRGCGYETAKTNYTPVKGHDYSIVAGVKRYATCTEKGLEIRACSRCSSTTEVNTGELGHDYEKRIVPPTCTARGYTVYTCKRSGCSYSYTGDYTNAKGHSTTTKTVPPSCTTQGYSYDYCTRSGCTYKSGNKNYTAALGHDYSKLVGTKREATCTEAGLGIFACTRCSSTTEGNIEKLGHLTNLKIVSPTCTARGYSVITCTRDGCGYSNVYDYKDALGHSISTKTVAPTCLTQGYSYDYCTRNGCTYKSENKNFTPVSGHDYSVLVGTKREATCTEKGLGIFKCSTCSSTTEANTIELGHLPVFNVTEPTCEEDGYLITVCERKGCHYFDKVKTKDALGHDLLSLPYKEPTCIQPGYTLHYCVREGCTYKCETDQTPYLGHDYIHKVVEPTCTQPGFTISGCQRECCAGDLEKYAFTDPLGHNLVKKVVKPTCTTRGYTVYYCDREGCTYSNTTDYVDALNHDTVTKTVEPSCATKGYTLTTCKRRGCGYSLRENVVDALGHSYTVKVGTKRAPTCEEMGLYILKCERCTSVTEGNGPALGHDEETREVEATCTTKGCTLTTCKRRGCGYSLRENVVDALGHSYTVKVGTKRPATCTQSGIGIYKCENCTSITDGTIASFGGHDIQETVVAPTYSDEGYTLKTCKRRGCDYSLKTNYKPILIKKSATITLSPNNGTRPWTVTKNQGMPYGTLPTVTKTGYTFKGWYTATSGGTKITSTSLVPKSSSVTLYAQWTKNSYTITFDANGGEGVPSDISGVLHGSLVKIPTTTPTRKDYTFLGWSTSKYADSATYKPSGSFTARQDMTLYAVWEARTCTILFNVHGGKYIKPIAIPFDQITFGVLPEATHSEPCYTFAGWYTDRTYKTPVTKDTIFPGTHVTLYAKWYTNHSVSGTGGYIEAPTCTEEGTYTRVICRTCGTPLAPVEKVDKLGHCYTYTGDTENKRLVADCINCTEKIDSITYTKYLGLRELSGASEDVRLNALGEYLEYLGYDNDATSNIAENYYEFISDADYNEQMEAYNYYMSASTLLTNLEKNQEVIDTMGNLAGMLTDALGDIKALSAVSDFAESVDFWIDVKNMLSNEPSDQIGGFVGVVSAPLDLFPPASLLYGPALDELKEALPNLVDAMLRRVTLYDLPDVMNQSITIVKYDANTRTDFEVTVNPFDVRLSDLAYSDNLDRMHDGLGDLFNAYMIVLLDYESYRLTTDDTDIPSLYQYLLSYRI